MFKNYDEQFLTFWKAYPKRDADSKFLAYKAYLKAIKTVEFKDLMEAVEIYKGMKDVIRGYNKLCATWLNQRIYETILEDKHLYSSKHFLDSLKEFK